MRLEQQLLYEPRSFEPRQNREKVYTIVDLEYLSASVLYSGDSKSRSSDGSKSLSWGKSFKADLYIKETPLGSLHVHCTEDGLVTGAKFNGKPISNYEAALKDLLPGKSFYKKGFGKW